ncbi:MAG TPA: GNAT family N-acetyltransferase [Bacteriovoracaceae bacterium]|nr:GNAT family N-acetyltransferase [Bacteriovoracaceae bacterium]
MGHTIKLQTPRLTLNSFTIKDTEKVPLLPNNLRVAEMTAGLPYPYTIQHARDWIAAHDALLENDGDHIFAIRLTCSSELIGCINLGLNAAHDRGYLGFWLGQAFWDQGYGTEAVQEIVRFGFSVKGLNKIWAEYKSINPASGRILEKAGLREEGILRNHYRQSENSYLDLHVMAMLRDEYKEAAGKPLPCG